MRRAPGTSGVLVVDKPAGMTSHDVVSRCRKRFGQRQVGHGGTLDPDATGVLVVGLGRATRLLRYVSGLPKLYRGEVVLGVATSTLDASGEVVGRFDMAGVTAEAVRTAAAAMVGEIDQIPPMVSALKVGGRRLHELARAGMEVEREPRRVSVARFEVEPVAADPGVYAVVVECSSGTYVRSLAADLGAALGGGAHLRNLRREAVGQFTLDGAVALDCAGPEHVLPMLEAVGTLERVTVEGELLTAVGHGAVLDRAALGVSGEGPWAVVDAGGDLLAVYEGRGPDRAKPTVVVAAPTAPGGAGS